LIIIFDYLAYQLYTRQISSGICLEPRGPGFKSPRPHHIKFIWILTWY